jgi:hypothetical protein
MSANNSSTVFAALILTLGFLTTTAVGGTAIHDPPGRHAERAHPHTTLTASHHGARYDAAHHAGYAGAHASPNFFAPGYVFVPGHGILGEDCNMPTSTCPNELRDTQ